MIQEYSTHPSLRSVAGHFWKYMLYWQSSSFIITVTFQADAMRCPGQFGGVDDLSPTFFAGMEVDVDVRNQYFHHSVLI
jgi:hypothetical protein